jgi:hypothetical protein
MSAIRHAAVILPLLSRLPDTGRLVPGSGKAVVVRENDTAVVTAGLTVTPGVTHYGGMSSQPGGDTSWDVVLAHRPPDGRAAVRERFESAGVAAGQVLAALSDGGDELYAAAAGGSHDWAKPFGGALAVALLAAEVSAMTAHLTSRGSAIRAVAVEALLDDYSAVTVANRLGVSRQKVYEIARPNTTTPFLDRAPWRLP